MVVTYGEFPQHTAEELKQFAADNEPLWAEGVQSEITPAGNRFIPSLKEVHLLMGVVGVGNKVVAPKVLAPDWHLEVVFSRTAKDGFVENAVFRNRQTDGRIALFFPHRPLDFFLIDYAPDLARAQGKVFSEFIQNWVHKVAAVRPQGRLATTWGHLKKE